MAELATPSPVLAGFIASLRKLSTDEGYLHLQSVVDDNATVHQNYEEARGCCNQLRRDLLNTEEDLKDMTAKYTSGRTALERSNAEKTAVIRELKETKQLLEEAEAEKDTQEAQLAKLDAEVAELKVKLQAEASQHLSANSAREYAEKKKDEVKEQLRKTAEDLREASMKLRALQERAVPLKDPMPLETIAKGLKPLFARAEDVFNKHLPTMLDESQLKGPSELLKQLQEKSELPLPHSNTPAALKMRQLAALACLGGALAENIFQPVYANDPEGRTLLHNLARHTPERELYVRQVLLSVAERYGELADLRVKRTVDDVMNCVAPLLLRNPKKASELRQGLQGVCKTAAEEWYRLQSVKERVEASVEVVMTDDREPKYDEGEREYWRVLPFSLHDTRASINGDSANGTTTNGATSNKAGRRGKSPAPLTECRDIKAVVWPSFTSVPGNGQELVILAGSVVTAHQVAVAQTELDSGTGPLKRRRTGKRGQPSYDTNGPVESFLSQEGGGGSKGS